MFDDPQLKNTGQVPPNLPMGEPEDIFAGAETKTPAPAASSAPPPMPVPRPEPAPPVASPPPSALGAGILRPKGVADALASSPPQVAAPPASRPPSPVPSVKPVPPIMSPSMEEDEGPYQLKEPIGRKSIITWIVILVFIVILGGGAIWVYFSFIRGGGGGASKRLSPALPIPALTPPQSPLDTQGQTTGTAQTNDSNVLFGGEVLDTDNDGLDDVREKDIHTDPLNWDTDGDGLSDGDEVNIWKTNPLNPDTDGDGYKDGAEVKNGYNPSGNGKLFEPPTTTE